DEVDPKRATDAKPSAKRALQSIQGPDGQREYDEEDRICMRPGFVEEDGLRGAERRVHRPADDDREAGHLQRAPELGAPDVKDLGEERRYRLLPAAAIRSAGRRRPSAERRCAPQSADGCRTAG